MVKFGYTILYVKDVTKSIEFYEKSFGFERKFITPENVHQIRNACRYVVWKDRKAFTRDMKEIYTAPTLLRMQHGQHSTILLKNGIQNTRMLSKVGGTIGMNSQFSLITRLKSEKLSIPQI
ncbi:glyoxalase/bleomycin resistance protein/dioxygenase [Nitritalea halalkaliphila LW7]|uniref:Glyoxalase/bleomycin resistance protein/dioxygenase n=1 Tax=Nitritalea halalkaliphila LW7 TaxID=1189621 RepID=I5C089_9BACT|nr:VOC family protein [Nitritalea halalkaliphila]EIM75241.1 glyoxalase/bleomycin resistance protein/dioxygenase [Nitritalea halalkaliphila LW7]